MSQYSTEDKRGWANDLYAWLEAYVGAGFTREEAMQIICKATVTVQGSQMTPDMHEMVERVNAVYSRLLSNMKDGE